MADREAVGRPARGDGLDGWRTGPHARIAAEVVRKVVHLRWKERLGPVAIVARIGPPTLNVHAVLTRRRLNRLHHVDVRIRESVRRYEHQ